jgi:alpha-tubulin suppressor-like RCC1 family protein
MKQFHLLSVAVILAAACGESSISPAEPGPLLPAKVTFSGFALSSVDGGVQFTCGLSKVGQAFCWGSNSDEQLGDGTGSLSSSDVPVAVSTGLRFSRLTTGFSHACAIAKSGQAYCWGSDFRGELGSSGSGFFPSLVSGGHSFTSISAGTHRSTGSHSRRARFCLGDCRDIPQLRGDPVFRGVVLG